MRQMQCRAGKERGLVDFHRLSGSELALQNRPHFSLVRSLRWHFVERKHGRRNDLILRRLVFSHQGGRDEGNRKEHAQLAASKGHLPSCLGTKKRWWACVCQV